MTTLRSPLAAALGAALAVALAAAPAPARTKPKPKPAVAADKAADEASVTKWKADNAACQADNKTRCAPAQQASQHSTKAACPLAKVGGFLCAWGA